jgi:transposase-like protein
METNVVTERLAFVSDLESGHWSMTELCERYGVTRPTGYKWLARHQAGGRPALTDRSTLRRPTSDSRSQWKPRPAL